MVLLAGLRPRPARADGEPWLLDAELALGMPLAQPQRDWFGFGGALALGVQKPLSSWFGLRARLTTAGFTDGDTPARAGVDDPGFGSLNTASLGVAFRLPDGSARRATGLWFEAHGGGGFTGSELRPAFDVGAGYGFAITERAALSPLVRYMQVLQFGSGLSTADAHLGFVGVRLSLFDAAPPKKQAIVEQGPPDRDHDGILDATDQCVDVPEDRDGYKDEDGCPEADNDGDGLFDDKDGCPNIAEDFDGYQDDDGCLDDDNDQDGVLDGEDRCPLEPETLNGEQDEDGCPDKGLIVMEDDRIILEERVLFDVQRARVKSSAGAVLQAIVRLWKQHPEWQRVRIEGHADVRGDATFNQQLSERRAANVRDALIKLGMNPEAVVAEGYGATRLLTTGTEEEDHRRNRRVEFAVIARYGDVGAPAEPPATPASPVSAPDAASAPEGASQSPVVNPFEDPEAGATERAAEETQP